MKRGKKKATRPDLNPDPGVLRIGLFGLGRTGSWVARELIDSPEAHLAWVVRRTSSHVGEFASRIQGLERDEGRIYTVDELTPDFFARNPVDVIIDFSTAGAAPLYAPAARLGIRVVSAVSKYDADDLAVLRKMAHHTAVLYSPNISIGINLLLLAALVLRHVIPEADVAIIEEHFRAKPEISGTALRLAHKLGIEPAEVKSIRAGGIVGRHQVIFGLPSQTLRLTHESISRAAFGRGALMGARWLMYCKSGLYTMEQMMLQRFASAVKALHAEPAPP